MKDEGTQKSFTGLWVIFIALLFGWLMYFSDQVTFVHAPVNMVEKVISLPAIAGYYLTEDRMMTALFAGVIWLGSILVVAGISWRIIQRKVWEPWRIRKFIEAKRREKQWLNRFDDDTI